MVLLGDVDRLHLLVHPGGLLGIALHDGEHQHVEGGVGVVQDLPPHLGCQQTHLLVNILKQEKLIKRKQTLPNLQVLKIEINYSSL